jgi:uncharacterized protein
MSSDVAVLVFVRAPQIGRVKTRLAAAIGPAAALRIYRRLAEQVVREARMLGGAAVRVHYTPAGTEEEVRAWLGEDLHYLCQSTGDLAERLTIAFDQAFEEGFGRVLVVGSDVPGLRTALLERALRSLTARTVVVGPANDGGYYLLGLTAPAPDLFRGIDWSTPRVLEQTLSRAADARLGVVLLDELPDVDRADDIPEAWRHLIEPLKRPE